MKCFSAVSWKDLSTEALSTCFWPLKAKVNDYLNCNDIVQCVHVSSYLFTMMTLFCSSDAVLSSNIKLTCSFIFVLFFCFFLFAFNKTKHGLSIYVVLIVKGLFYKRKEYVIHHGQTERKVRRVDIICMVLFIEIIKETYIGSL